MGCYDVVLEDSTFSTTLEKMSYPRASGSINYLFFFEIKRERERERRSCLSYPSYDLRSSAIGNTFNSWHFLIIILYTIKKTKDRRGEYCCDSFATSTIRKWLIVLFIHQQAIVVSSQFTPVLRCEMACLFFSSESSSTSLKVSLLTLRK